MGMSVNVHCQAAQSWSEVVPALDTVACFACFGQHALHYAKHLAVLPGKLGMNGYQQHKTKKGAKKNVLVSLLSPATVWVVQVEHPSF